MAKVAQVYYPHVPYRSITYSNLPGAKAVYADELQATGCASGIRVVRDDPKATVLRFEFEPGRVEWVVFNPEGQPLKVGSLETNNPLAYQPADK